ncbi:MAG TPA: APC family permease, partial [Blastocatellia bacterium]|nr:APC family permease [Blastocatellia bacterium]
AKVSVSALMFDYILTGPISGVSAGQYIVGLIAQTMTYFGRPWSPSADATNHISAVIAIIATLYYWWRNIKGVRESSTDALRIMKVTTAMVALMILWCCYTLIEKGPRQLPAAPTAHNLKFDRTALGWLPNIIPGSFKELPPPPVASDASASEAAAAPRLGLVENAGWLLGLIGIMIAFGHSVLAMSGEETLSQVNRELEHPKHKNLVRAGLVIFVYSLLFTSLVSFFASLLIPDSERPKYFDNLISGLTMFVAGPLWMRLMFQAFVVIVGFLILSGAINAAIVGSNGVLNRVSEDGVMTDWFRAPHSKYGTTYRMINLIVALQLITIIGSRGDVFALGEAYAFGVVWSFAFNGLATLVLRYKDKSEREWKVPGNIKIAGREIPLGLGFVAGTLFAIAILNLFTKQIATVSGLSFTLIFFVIFAISEKVNLRKASLAAASLDQFRLTYQQDIDVGVVRVRPGNVLVPVRDYHTLSHLGKVLDRTKTEEQDIVVVTVRLLTGPDAGERDLYESSLFTDYEQRLFTQVVAIAEKHGKPVELLVVPANDVFDAVAQTAVKLDSAEIVSGPSAKMTVQDQARYLGRSWERLPERPRRQVTFTILDAEAKESHVLLGAHAPDLTKDDVDLIHRIWIQVSKIPSRRRVHHRDVVRVALNRLERDLRTGGDVMLDFYKLEHENGHEKARGKPTGSDKK